MKQIIERSIQYENVLTRLLNKEGYIIDKKESFGGKKHRPDFVIRKGNIKSIVELKVQNIVTERVLYQILYYLNELKIKKGYLAIPKESKINKKIKQKLLDNNIGIIEIINKKKLNIIEPVAYSKLTEKEKEKLEDYSDKKSLSIDINRTKEKLEELNKQLWLYILLGGIMFYSITELLDYYFNKPMYLWYSFSISLIIIIGLYIYIWWKQ